MDDIGKKEFEEAKERANYHGLSAKEKSDRGVTTALRHASNAMKRGDTESHNFWLRRAYDSLQKRTGK